MKDAMKNMMSCEDRAMNSNVCLGWNGHVDVDLSAPSPRMRDLLHDKTSVQCTMLSVVIDYLSIHSRLSNLCNVSC
jgi:hypothetical protein